MTVRDAFTAQGTVCEALGSPFMGRLMPLIGARLAPDGPVADRILTWSGDTSASGDSVPLRLAGALHALKIEGLALAGVYPPHSVDDDTLWTAVKAALVTYEPRIMSWLDSPPQTNEIRRSVPLIAALSALSDRYNQPVELLELGCSAGLNLRADHFWIVADGKAFGPKDASVTISPEWRCTIPTAVPLPIVGRRGVDLSPIDPATEEGRLRLLAYLWPDQPERITMTDAAIDVARRVPAEISAGDAGAWLEHALAEPASDRTRVVLHTVAWQYFPGTTKSHALRAMEQAQSPLVRFAMEADGGRGARLTLTHYPAGETQDLGRVDFHGRWIDWTG